MPKIKSGSSIKTKTISYEIKILGLSRPIPEEESDNFEDWLTTQTNTCPCGNNYEYFSYNENSEDDIGVNFNIAEINTKQSLSLQKIIRRFGFTFIWALVLVLIKAVIPNEIIAEVSFLTGWLFCMIWDTVFD